MKCNPFRVFTPSVEGASHAGVLHPRAGSDPGRPADSSWPGAHLQWLPQRPGWSSHRRTQTPLWLPQGERLRVTATDKAKMCFTTGFDLNELLLTKLLYVGFFQLLHAEKRREYLYQLQEFMVTDNSRNWRFRYELAEYVFSLIQALAEWPHMLSQSAKEFWWIGQLTWLFFPILLRQLILIIELYSHYDVYDYLRQIALTLCSDKVSEVRWISYKLVSCQRVIGLFLAYFWQIFHSWCVRAEWWIVIVDTITGIVKAAHILVTWQVSKPENPIPSPLLYFSIVWFGERSALQTYRMLIFDNVLIIFYNFPPSLCFLQICYYTVSEVCVD